MKTSWVKGVTEKQEKEEIKSSFKSSAYIRARLAEMLARKMQEKEKACMSDDGYECANWAHKMADAQGYKRALSEIISLITEK